MIVLSRIRNEFGAPSDLAIQVITIIEMERLLVFSYFWCYARIGVLRRHMNQTIRITAGLR